MKRFTTTGKCNPSVHYMVNIDRQVGAAAQLVRQGDYFCINRGRQFGKTTQIFSLGQIDKSQFIHDGHIDMRRLLERFCVHFNEIYRPDHDDQFVEDHGRKIFLTYLRPIINGVGNYYCEAQTRDLTRTDIIIDYLGQQYIIELKIWRGQSYNTRGEKQLAEYLDYYHLHTGYMLSFCFGKNKQPGLHEVSVGNHLLIEAVV